MLTFPANVTLDGVTALTAQLHEGRNHDSSSPFVVEMGALTHFDSSALALLLECRRESLRHKQPISIKNAPDKLLVLADLYGVRDILGLSPFAIQS